MATHPAHSLSLSWDELHQDTRALAQRLADRSFTAIAGIARGGLVPAAIIARELGIRQVDTICIASYDDHIQGQARLLKGIDGDGSGLLVIDDLVDTGVTAPWCVRCCQRPISQRFMPNLLAAPIPIHS